MLLRALFMLFPHSEHPWGAPHRACARTCDWVPPCQHPPAKHPPEDFLEHPEFPEHLPEHPSSGTDMTGRPGCRTMKIIGGSSVPHLTCTPCVPLFCTLFNRGGNRRVFRLPRAGGGSFPLCGGTFARSEHFSGFSLRALL